MAKKPIRELPKFESELDYMQKMIIYLDEKHQACLHDKKENKEEMDRLQKDIPGITSPRLQKAAKDTFNHFSMENTKLTNAIKEIREEQKWNRRILKIVKEWFRKHER